MKLFVSFLVVLCSIWTSWGMGTMTVSSNLGDTGISNFGAAYVPSADVYCIGGENARISCFSGSTHSLIISHQVNGNAGNIFWVQPFLVNTPTSGVLAGVVFCNNDANSGVYTLTVNSSRIMNAPIRRLALDDIESCSIDFDSNRMFIAHDPISAGRRYFQVDIGSVDDQQTTSTWATNTLTYNQDNNAAFFLDHSNPIIRGTNPNTVGFRSTRFSTIRTTRLTNGQTSFTTSVFGGGNPLSYATDLTDNSNTFLYIGTDIGLVWRIDVTDGSIDEVHIFLDYLVQSVEIDTLTDVVFSFGRMSSTGPARVIRVNPATGGAVFDQIDIPGETGDIGSTAIDPVQRRLFIFFDNGNRYVINYGVCTATGFGDDCVSCLDPDLGDPIYCDWCYDPGSCENSCTNPLGSTAPAESNFANCPSLLSVAPLTGIAGTNITVSLSNNVARPQLNLQCRIDMVNTPGTLNMANNVLTCTTPITGMGVDSVSVVYPGGVPFVQNSGLFSFVSCSDSTTCGQCTAPGNEACNWCLDTVSCMPNGMCATTSIANGGTCPVFSLAPASAPSGTSVTLRASGGPFVNNGGTYQFLVNPGAITVAATFTNTSLITGTTRTYATNSYSVALRRNGQDYFGATQPFAAFDCASISTCEQCTNPVIACSWCTEDRSCTSTPASCTLGASAVTPTGQCPASLGPVPEATFTTGSGSSLDIFTFGSFPTMGTYQCTFGANTVSATRIATTPARVQCANVPAGTGSVTLNVLHQGTPIVTDTFLYFTCDEFDGSCSECLDPQLNGACEFCLNDLNCNVAGSGGCASTPFSTCPTITDASPAGVEVDTTETITLTLSQAVPNLMNFQCIWTTPTTPTATVEVRSATRTSPTTLTCMGPNPVSMLIDEVVTSYQADLQIRVGMTALLNANDMQSVTVYDCPLFGTGDCPSCSALPFCGFCLGPNSCNSFQGCLNAGGVDGLWLDSAMGCPQIDAVQPDHTTLEGMDPITVTGSLFLLDNLECQFGDMGSTPALRMSTSMLTCTTPPGVASATNLSIVQSGIPYSANAAGFSFVDCAQYENCETCVSDTANFDLCGWCLSSASCTPAFDCTTNNNNDWTTAQCPTISAIDPGFVNSGSEEEFTITGTLFRSGIEVLFDAQPATQVTVVDENTITGRTPSIDEEASLSVSLQIQGRPYTSANLNFNVIPASNSSNAGMIAGIAVGVGVGVLCCFVCCVACIFYVFYARFKAILSRRTVKIVEPKWDVIAYSNWLTPQYKGKTLRDYGDFIDLLLGPQAPAILRATHACTQTTEQDALARALTYIYGGEKKAADLIIKWVDLEIEEAAALEQKETLFRANSITTKMFKYYAKMVGTHYLFELLARFVAEMELSHKLQQENETELNTLQDMELDPNKLDPEMDELQVQENKQNLLSFSQKILNAILRSSKDLPPSLLAITLHVRDKVEKTFKDSKLTFKSIGAFLFLRFICPAIAAPESYFQENPPDNYVRRQLVLVSKMLQNLANGVEFGGKEQFMAPLNPFITENADNLRKFYEKLNQASESQDEIDVPDDALFNSCAWTHIHMSQVQNNIRDELHKTTKYPEGASCWTDLKTQLEKLAPVPNKALSKPAKSSKKITN